MMSPGRTDRDGNFRFNRVFKDVGRISRTSGTRKLREFRKRDAILTKLHENAQLDVLRAFRNADVSIEQLVEADRAGKLKSAELLSELAKRRPLWAAIDEVLPRMGRSVRTRARYHTSFTKLRRSVAGLGRSARVRDLLTVRWDELEANWIGSPADWNNMRRALSAFLSITLGDVYHPFRRAVMKAIPTRRETARKPVVAPHFWDIVRATPEHARAAYVVLGATGMRVGEYLACTAANLRPEVHAIDAPSGKTGARRYFVDPAFWEWVERGVPAPLRYGWLRRYFTRACDVVGVGTLTITTEPVLDSRGAPRRRADGRRMFRRRQHYTGLRLHDLRHLFAQLAKREGVPTADTQAALGQRTPGITRDYEMEEVQSTVARAVGRGLTKRRAG